MYPGGAFFVHGRSHDSFIKLTAHGVSNLQQPNCLFTETTNKHQSSVLLAILERFIRQPVNTNNQ